MNYYTVVPPGTSTTKCHAGRGIRHGTIWGILFAQIGCGAPQPHIAMRAPNPNGCYVMFYEQPDFCGASDLMNGPGKWPALEELRETNYPDWENSISSLRVGRIATLTVFADPGFRGDSEQYAAGSEHTTLRPPLSDNVESLQVSCTPQLAGGTP